jgi:hypothetical protein
MPGLDHGLDWADRSAADVPMGDDRRGQVDAAIAEVKLLVRATGLSVGNCRSATARPAAVACPPVRDPGVRHG